MTRHLPLLLLLLLVCIVPAADAADTTFDAEYTPAGPVIAGQELTISQNIFVGERFQDTYTLEFNTDLTDALWEIALVVENRTTRTWELPYTHATISGFTISTAERDTWLVTRLTGTPSPYDTGKDITLWQMKVMLTSDAAKDTFTANPIKVEQAPAPTAGPLTATQTPATGTQTPTPGQKPATEHTTPQTTIPVTTPPATTTPAQPPATPKTSFGGCGLCLLAAAGTLLLLRRR